MTWKVPTPKPTNQERQQHLEQARHNEQFLTHLIAKFPDSYYDWKVTACFYTALHWVRVFFVTRGISTSSHYDTLSYINPKVLSKPTGYISLPSLFYPCNTLMQYSQNARYQGFLHFADFDRLQKANFTKAYEALGLVKKALQAQGIKEAAE